MAPLYNPPVTKLGFGKSLSSPGTIAVAASFTRTSGLTQSFTDTSVGGNINSWLWDFGDGTTSTSQNPSHIFPSTGNFTVTLSASNDSGGVGTAETSFAIARIFPTSSAQWTSAFSTVPTPHSIWTAQDVSGPLVDNINAINLFSTGTVSFRNSGDPTGRFSVGLGTSSRFALSNPLIFDIGITGSISYFVRFSMPDNAASTRSIGGKREGSGNLIGYNISLPTTGSLAGLFRSGTTTFGATNIIAQDHTTNNYFDAMMVVDRTAGFVSIMSSLGSNSTSIATTITASFNSTNSGVFTIGTVVGVASNESGSMVSYAAVWNTPLTYDQFLTIIREQ